MACREQKQKRKFLKNVVVAIQVPCLFSLCNAHRPNVKFLGRWVPQFTYLVKFIPTPGPKIRSRAELLEVNSHYATHAASSPKAGNIVHSFSAA